MSKKQETMKFAVIAHCFPLGVSAVIGIVFGWYPAKKAANLASIEARRYE